MLGRLILIFILVPLADLILLLWLAQYTGWEVSVALVIVSGIVGAYLARRASQSVTAKMRDKFSQGQFEPGLLTDGAMIFFAAGLLLTPGFITDVLGFTILIPPCREWYKKIIGGWLKHNFKVHVVSGSSDPFGGGPRSEQGSNTVDGEVVHRDGDSNSAEMDPPQRITDTKPDSSL
ncbi:MAG: FxsA family protein [Planctomycetota bacterium]